MPLRNFNSKFKRKEANIYLSVCVTFQHLIVDVFGEINFSPVDRVRRYFKN